MEQIKQLYLGGESPALKQLLNGYSFSTGLSYVFSDYWKISMRGLSCKTGYLS